MTSHDPPPHGGYPGEIPEASPVLLNFLTVAEWRAIESAAQAPNSILADFYRAKAGYGLRY